MIFQKSDHLKKELASRLDRTTLGLFLWEMHLRISEYGAHPKDYLSLKNTKLTTSSMTDGVLLLDANLISHKSKIKIKTKYNRFIAS
jgi:hypothetical protein